MVTILGFCLVLLLLFAFVYIMKLLGFIMRDRSKEAAQPACAPAAKAPKSIKPGKASENDLAAIAMALHLNEQNTDMAAVAMALNLYYGVHYTATPRITLQGHATAWNNKAITLIGESVNR